MYCWEGHLGAQVREHGEHAPMVFRGRRELQLGEDAGHVLLDGALGDAEQLVVTDRAVEKHVTSIFSKLRLPAASEDHRRVLAVLAYLRS